MNLSAENKTVYPTHNYSMRKPPGLKLIFCDLTSFQHTYTNLDLAIEWIENTQQNDKPNQQ